MHTPPYLRALSFILLALILTPTIWGQTPYAMSAGDKTWTFADIANWTNNFANGTDAANWGSVGIIGSGTSVTTGTRTTKSSATFVTGASGGLQRGTQSMVLLSTGSGSTPEAVAVDLFLNFTGRTSGTLSFDWAAIDNSSGTRPTSLRVFSSTDGTTFTELTGAQVLDQVSSSSGSITSVALPTAFNNSATARLRFYNHAGNTTVGSGNRDKMQIDNVAITSAPVPPPTIASPTTSEIAAFTTPYGTPSATQNFTVTASNLTANLVATAPTGFEVTSDATTWDGTATFTPAAGAVAGTLGVRLAATAPVSGSYNSAAITLTSTGATSVTLTTPAAGSSVSPAALTVTADPVVKAFGQTLASPVVGSTAFMSSALQNSETLDSVTITYGSGAAATDPVGDYLESVQPSAATGGTFDPTNYTITYVSGDLTVTDEPLVLIDGILTAMTATYGSASPSQMFTVSGSNLTEDLEVTAPAGFEVSFQESSGYGTSVTLTPASGQVAVTTVYVRLAAGSAAGPVASGNLTVNSTGADSKTLDVPAGDIDAKMLTIDGLTGANKEYDRTTVATFTGTPDLVGVVTGDEAGVTLGGTPSAIFAQATVDTGIAITVSGYEITGGMAGNYSLTQPTGLTGDIMQKELTVSGAAVTTREVNGGNAATITGTLVGVIAPDVVTLIGTGTFANNGPGVGIAVTSTSTLGGADAGNYSLTQPVGLTGTITGAREAFTQWTFEGDTLIPAVGQGTASNFGGTNTTFATGNGGGTGWNTSPYPAQSAGSGTSGVQIAVSTVGWQEIVLNFDHRSSGTGSRWAQVDYSLNGGATWVTGFWNNHDTANGGLATGLAPYDNYYSFTVDFTSIAGANNNPNFVVRVVSIFSPVAFSDGLGNSFDANAAYHRPRDSGGSVYGGSGTWRFDNVQFTGTEAPFAFVNSTPAADAVDAPVASTIVLGFNKPATLSADAVTLTDEAMNVLTYTIEGNGEIDVSLIPTVNLPAFQTITVTLDETQINSGSEQLPVTPPFSFKTEAVYNGPQIAVSAPATSATLTPLVYTITLTNTDAMAGVGPFDVTFTLPAGTTYASSQIPTGTVSVVGSTVTVTAAEIGPSADQILEIAVLPIAGLITLPPGAVRVDFGPAFALSTENLETEVAPASFDPDTLVLYTVGDGTTPITDSATPIRLLEMSTGGVIRQTIELPRLGASALVARGATTTGGMISLSDDGTTLLVPGYRKEVGGSNPESDSPATTPRVIGALSFNGSIDTTTAITTLFTGAFRSVAASANLQQIYAVGENGVHLVPGIGATTSTNIYSANLRNSLVTGGRLYVSTGSTAASVANFELGVGSFTTPLPTTGPLAVEDTVGLVNQGSGTSQGFVLLDRDPVVPGLDTLYVADSSSSQLDKYSFDGTTWTARGSLSLDPAEAMFGVTGKVVNAEANLYVTTATKLLSLVDSTAFNSDISGNFQPIHTAANNTTFRGVAFAPQPLLPAVVSVTPADEAVDVAQSAVIEITFNQEVNVAANAFVIEAPAGTPIAYTLSPASGSSSSFTLTPNNPLPDFGVVNIRVNSEFVTSLDGSAMPADFVSEFTVAGTPEPIVITQQPQSQVVAVASLPSVQFTVGFTGTVQSYQWQYRAPLAADFEDIPGPFGTSQTLAGLGILTGDYRVVLTGPISSVTSQTATLSLTGNARIAAQSGNQLIGLGAPLRLEIFANGTLPRQFAWFRNGRAIAKSNSSVFQVASSTRSTGGVYIGTVANDLATDLSNAILVGVVTAPARSYFVQPNSRLTFSVRVDGRSDVTYQWYFDNAPINGQSASTLTLNNIQLEAAGEYFCRVSAPGTAPFDGGIQTVAVFNAAPEIDEPVTMPPGMVSAEYGPFLIPVKADDPANEIFRKPAIFSARGLPAGLRVNASTGEISGVPNVAVENRSVTLTASNALGSSSVTVLLTIEPLAGRAIGTFAGIIERNDHLNQGLGGSVDMTVRPTGQFTVAVRQGTRLYRGRGRLTANRDTPAILEIDVDVSRGKNVQPLRLQFKLDAGNEVLFDASVSADGYTADLEGWRNPWFKTRDNRRPAEAVAGRYNATIGLQVPPSGPSPVGDVNVPQGFGYISFVVSPTTGRLRLSGRLVDGTALTGATFVGFGGQVRVFQGMYAATVRGSLLGQMMIDDLNDADPNNNTLGSESMNWFRPANPATTNRYFKNVEIDLDLDVEGGRYLAPARNVRVLGLTDGQPNAQLTFANANIETATPLQPDGTLPTFALSVINRTTFLNPDTTNPRGVTFAVNASSGLFKGKINLGVPPDLRRMVSYQGILVPGNEGAGYFLLDQLPGGDETIRTSPRLSGAVLLSPVPPSLP